MKRKTVARRSEKQEEKCRLTININFLINIRCHAASSHRHYSYRSQGSRSCSSEEEAIEDIPQLIHRRLKSFIAVVF